MTKSDGGAVKMPGSEHQNREFDRFAIVNKYGGIWTPNVWNTPQEAEQYLRAYWRNDPKMLDGFTIAMVAVTLRPVEAFEPIRVKPARDAQ